MKEQFQQFKTLKPETEAKLKILEIVEEKEMTKQNKKVLLWKPIVAIVFICGLLSVPAIQNQLSDSMNVKAQQVETINQQIEVANTKVSKQEITYKQYDEITKPLLQERNQLVGELKEQGTKIKFRIVETVSKNELDKTINITIEEEK